MDGESTGSARRRRERRLRSWWRHERMSIAAALVEATHHSAPRSGWPGTHQALRGQTTTSASTCSTRKTSEVGGQEHCQCCLRRRRLCHTLTSQLCAYQSWKKTLVTDRVWEVEACFSERAILNEFRGEWEEIARDNAVLLLGSGTLRFLMVGEDHEVVDRTWWGGLRPFCWRTENPKLRPEVCLQGDCPLLQCFSR